MKEAELVHVIDYKNKTIKAMDNLELSCFMNECILGQEKRYLLMPNAEIAFQALTGEEMGESK